MCKVKEALCFEDYFPETDEQYLERLEKIRATIDKHCVPESWRNGEYGQYLKRWFSDEVICDGGTYEQKVRRHQYPMSWVEYAFG